MDDELLAGFDSDEDLIGGEPFESDYSLSSDTDITGSDVDAHDFDESMDSDSDYDEDIDDLLTRVSYRVMRQRLSDDRAVVSRQRPAIDLEQPQHAIHSSHQHYPLPSHLQHYQTADVLCWLGANRVALSSIDLRVEGQLRQPFPIISIYQLPEDDQGAPILLAQKLAPSKDHYSLAASPDGRFLATAGSYSLVSLWWLGDSPDAVKLDHVVTLAVGRTSYFRTSRHPPMANSIRFGIIGGQMRLIVGHQDCHVYIFEVPDDPTCVTAQSFSCTQLIQPLDTSTPDEAPLVARPSSCSQRLSSPEATTSHIATDAPTPVAPQAAPGALQAVPDTLGAVPAPLQAVPGAPQAVPEALQAVPRGLQSVPGALPAVPQPETSHQPDVSTAAKAYIDNKPPSKAVTAAARKLRYLLDLHADKLRSLAALAPLPNAMLDKPPAGSMIHRFAPTCVSPSSNPPLSPASLPDESNFPTPHLPNLSTLPAVFYPLPLDLHQGIVEGPQLPSATTEHPTTMLPNALPQVQAVPSCTTVPPEVTPHVTAAPSPPTAHPISMLPDAAPQLQAIPSSSAPPAHSPQASNMGTSLPSTASWFGEAADSVDQLTVRHPSLVLHIGPIQSLNQPRSRPRPPPHKIIQRQGHGGESESESESEAEGEDKPDNRDGNRVRVGYHRTWSAGDVTAVQRVVAWENWFMKPQFETACVGPFDYAVNCADVSKDGRWLGVVADHGVLCVFPVAAGCGGQPGRKMATPERPQPSNAHFQYLAFNADSTLLAATSDSLRAVYVWTLTTGQQVFKVCDHRQAVLALCWSPTDPYLLAYCEQMDHVLLADVRAGVWGLQHLRVASVPNSQPLPHIPQRINGVKITDDGQLLVAGWFELNKWRMLPTWSHSSHKHFPSRFKQAAHMLLAASSIHPLTGLPYHPCPIQPSFTHLPTGVLEAIILHSSRPLIDWLSPHTAQDIRGSPATAHDIQGSPATAHDARGSPATKACASTSSWHQPANIPDDSTMSESGRNMHTRQSMEIEREGRIDDIEGPEGVHRQGDTWRRVREGGSASVSNSAMELNGPGDASKRGRGGPSTSGSSSEVEPSHQQNPDGKTLAARQTQVHMASEDVDITPEDVDITPKDEHITPEDVDITPKDEHITPEDVDITPEDEHITPEDVDITPEDEHITPEDEHITSEDVDMLPGDADIPPGDMGPSTQAGPAATPRQTNCTSCSSFTAVYLSQLTIEAHDLARASIPWQTRCNHLWVTYLSILGPFAPHISKLVSMEAQTNNLRQGQAGTESSGSVEGKTLSELATKLSNREYRNPVEFQRDLLAFWEPVSDRDDEMWKQLVTANVKLLQALCQEWVPGGAEANLPL